jgi:ABC-2 type transport system ATP-binding protein
MIEARDLRKEYGGFVAVDDASFSVEAGEIFGIIGPNGAGKTTTLKMLSGLVEPTSGSATVAGHDSQDRSMRTRLGYLPEESPLYEDMTATSYLRFFADLYDVPRDVADERIDRTLSRLNLEHRDRKLGDVSKGMKRKVAIARSLVNDPDVLVYDEPASGLDPLTTNYIIDFVRELKDDGKTVVFSAHNLYHVESLCDRVVIMNRGEIVARGTLQEIREQHADVSYRLYLDDAVPGVDAVREDGRYRVDVDSMARVDAVRSAADEADVAVIDIRTDEASLEEIFLEVADAEASERSRYVDASAGDAG